MMPSPCPAPRNPLGKGSSEARLCVKTLLQSEAPAWGGCRQGPPCDTAPRHRPASPGWLTNTGGQELQKARLGCGLPFTRIQPGRGAPAHAKGQQRRFLAESWCTSLSLPKPRFSQPPLGHLFPFTCSLASAALCLALEKPPSLPASLAKHQHLR